MALARCAGSGRRRIRHARSRRRSFHKTRSSAHRRQRRRRQNPCRHAGLAKAAPKHAKKSAAHAPANSVAGILHATMLYSYLLRPTTANHEFAEVVLRHLNRTLSGAPGERADFLLRVAPVLRAEVEAQGLLDLYE